MVKIKEVEETENDLDTMLNEELEAIEAEQDSPFINCDEFKLLELEARGDRRYRVKFMADQATVTVPRDLIPDGLETNPFEDLYAELGRLVIPVLFPGAENSNLKKFRQRIVNNKNKEAESQTIFWIEFLPGS